MVNIYGPRWFIFNNKSQTFWEFLPKHGTTRPYLTQKWYCNCSAVRTDGAVHVPTPTFSFISGQPSPTMRFVCYCCTPSSSRLPCLLCLALPESCYFISPFNSPQMLGNVHMPNINAHCNTLFFSYCILHMLEIERALEQSQLIL